jgi:guanosine-3',5'-bis(diphosphate) 3'-pyrophosphohydrolase
MANYNEALAFAATRHSGQTRKYTNEPYIQHCMAVVEQLRAWGFEDRNSVLCAAILHDVVEDTKTTLQEVRERFGDTVAELVFWLTDYQKPKDGNRDTRTLMSAWRLARAPKYAQIIKLADISDNTASIARHDPEFAKVYLKEKARLLGLMEDAGIAPLGLIAKVRNKWGPPLLDKPAQEAG